MSQKNSSFVGIIRSNIVFVVSVFVSLVIFIILLFIFLPPQQDGIQLDTLSSQSNLPIPDLASVPDNSSTITNIWWQDNLTHHGDYVTVVYPAGSYKPSAAPVGGVWYIQRFKQWFEHARLSYNITFDEWFDFVKWWKLPGLCGWTCSRWWSGVENGFSARFMWRADGDLEVYWYTNDKKGQKWVSIWRGMYRFIPGVEYNISQEILLNTPGEADGKLIVYVDNQKVYELDSIMYRWNDSVTIDAFIFSTFFGWWDKSWATPISTGTKFSDFKLEY